MPREVKLVTDRVERTGWQSPIGKGPRLRAWFSGATRIVDAVTGEDAVQGWFSGRGHRGEAKAMLRRLKDRFTLVGGI